MAGIPSWQQDGFAYQRLHEKSFADGYRLPLGPETRCLPGMGMDLVKILERNQEDGCQVSIQPF
jgi:hypothetical protein